MALTHQVAHYRDTPIISKNLFCQPMFSIGLVYYNGIENLLSCMESLLAQNTNIPYEILFRDQSAKKEGIRFLNARFASDIKSEKIRLWSGENRMHSGGHNALFLEKKYEYYCCASIDMSYEPTMLTSFQNAIQQFPETKIWGGKIVQKKESTIDSVGLEKTWYGRIVERGFGEPPSKYNLPEKVFGISGALFCIHPSAIDPNEPLFEPSIHYKNDGELMMRMEKKGYRVQYFPDILANHDRLANKNSQKSLFILKSSLQGQIFIMKKLPWYAQIPCALMIAMQYFRLFGARIKNKK